MTAMSGVLLAGELNDLGEGWIAMFKEWAEKGLVAGLAVLVVVTMVQRFSLKAGIGAILLMIVALALYASRNTLSDMFEDEVKHPVKSASAVPGIAREDQRPPVEQSLNAGGLS